MLLNRSRMIALDKMIEKINIFILLITYYALSIGCIWGGFKSEEEDEDNISDECIEIDDEKPFEGSYTIKSQDDLDKISEYTSVRGNLSIVDSSLETIRGLENIIIWRRILGLSIVYFI